MTDLPILIGVDERQFGLIHEALQLLLSIEKDDPQKSKKDHEILAALVAKSNRKVNTLAPTVNWWTES